jgi:hypothetical protein
MEDQRLSPLFNYTTFHIGLYATLISGLFATIAYTHEPQVETLSCLLPYAKGTAALILLAGASGGAIASNIPNHESFASFSAKPLNVFGISTMNYSVWAHIEHAAFWGAVSLAAYTFLRIACQVGGGPSL